MPDDINPVPVFPGISLEIIIAIIAVIIIAAIILLVLLFRQKKPSLKKLFARKRQILDELRLTEQKYLKRQLLENSYKEILRKKQQEMIKIDAEISQMQAKQKKLSKDEMLSVDSKQRHVLQELLTEKEKIQKEMNIAQKQYLKRKIDENTYKSLVHASQEKMISVEGRIQALQGDKSVKAVFNELKQKLRQDETESAKSERNETEKIAKEILEQMQSQ